MLRQAEAHAREELGATTALLLEQVAMHEVLLEAMYDVHSVAMYDVSRLSPQQVGRHQHRHGTTTTTTTTTSTAATTTGPTPADTPCLAALTLTLGVHASPRGPCVATPMQLSRAIHYTPNTIQPYSHTAIQRQTLYTKHYTAIQLYGYTAPYSTQPIQLCSGRPPTAAPTG